MTRRDRRRARARLGRARPGQPRAGRAGPRVPDGRLLRPGLVAVRGRPAARPTSRRSTRSSLRRARTRPGSTSGRGRPLRPAARAARPRGHRRRAVRRRCAARCARGWPSTGSATCAWSPAALARGRSSELGELPAADVALIAHVGYDIEAIGPFLDAMEAATRRPLRRGPHGPQPGVGRRPVLAARPRRGARRRCRPCPSSSSCSHARGRETEIRRVERPPRTFDCVAGAHHVPPPPAVDRRGRREGRPLPGDPAGPHHPPRRRLDARRSAARCHRHRDLAPRRSRRPWSSPRRAPLRRDAATLGVDDPVDAAHDPAAGYSRLRHPHGTPRARVANRCPVRRRIVDGQRPSPQRPRRARQEVSATERKEDGRA